METRIMFSDLFLLLEYNANLALGRKNILVLLRWAWVSWFMHKYMKPSSQLVDTSISLNLASQHVLDLGAGLEAPP